MNLQDAALLFVALFPFSLVIVGAVTLIRRKRNKVRLSLVQIDNPPAKAKKKRKAKRGNRK